MYVLCLICGKEIPSIKNNTKYCSWGCYVKSRTGKPNYNLRKRIKRVCPICRNEFETGGRKGSVDQIYCSLECSHKSQRKSLDDGIISNRANWKEIATDMKEKYNYTCQLCGKMELVSPHLLNVHHIVPRRVGGSSDVDNLIVLCISCHTVIERLSFIGYNQNSKFSPHNLIKDIKKCLYEYC